MRLVLDTNVLLAAILADGLCRNLVGKRIKPHELFSSAPLLEELSEKLRDKFGVDPEKVPFVVAYRDRITLVEVRPLATPVSRDSDDDIVLATSLAARAEVIVTGDKDLLILKTFEQIPILSPRQFLELLDRIE